MTGFCVADVKPFGPVHKYVAPAIMEAVSERFEPWHNGLLLPVVGDAGIAFIMTRVLAGTLVQPLTVAVAE